MRLCRSAASFCRDFVGAGGVRVATAKRRACQRQGLALCFMSLLGFAVQVCSGGIRAVVDGRGDCASFTPQERFAASISNKLAPALAEGALKKQARDKALVAKRKAFLAKKREVRVFYFCGCTF